MHSSLLIPKKLVGGTGLVKNRHESFVWVVLNNIWCLALVDTGSSVSIVDIKTHKLISAKLLDEQHKLSAVNESSIKCLGSSVVNVSICGYKFLHNFVIAETCVPILGWDMLDRHNIVIIPHKRMLQRKGKMLARLLERQSGDSPQPQQAVSTPQCEPMSVGHLNDKPVEAKETNIREITDSG